MTSRVLVVVLAVASFGIGGIPALADDPPTVTVTTTGVLTGWQKVGFNEPVTGVNASNLLLRVVAATSSLPASIVCRDVANVDTLCETGAVRTALIRGVQPLIPGEMYEVVVNPAGVATPIRDTGLNAAPTTIVPFHTSGVEQETSVAATYRWQPVSSAAASGGSYRTERRAGATATYRFTGTAVKWYTRRSPAQGKAIVTIDGGPDIPVNNYHAKTYMQPNPAAIRTFSVLPGDHVIVIRVLGRRDDRATGTWVAVDAFEVGGARAQDATSYTFQRAAASQASGGYVARADTPGSTVWFRFRGTGIAWYTITGPYEGKARVYVDGKYIQTIDNYSPRTHFGVRRAISGLADRVHALRITLSASRNARSRGTRLAIDRWLLRAETRTFRKLGAWMDLWDYTDATPSSTIQTRINVMKQHGVRTLYLQTGRYNTPSFKYPVQVGQWVETAHAAGIKVVGWYLPAYSEYLSGDVTKTVAIAIYRSPRGHRFDGLGIDIEFRAKNDSKSEFFQGITSHLGRVRTRVGVVFPVAAITFAPLDMDLWVAGWSGFPWRSVGKSANVVMPMGYWSNRASRCSGGATEYCAYGYTKQNITRARSYTGLPVHEIGGVGSDSTITTSQVAAYVKACKDAGSIGGSFYDDRTTKASWWAPLEGLNA